MTDNALPLTTTLSVFCVPLRAHVDVNEALPPIVTAAPWSTRLFAFGAVSLLACFAPVLLDSPVAPRGYRLLAKVSRLPGTVVERLVDHFGGLQKLLGAGIDDLQAVEGVGELRARSVREGLSRLAESSILERYV